MYLVCVASSTLRGGEAGRCRLQEFGEWVEERQRHILDRRGGQPEAEQLDGLRVVGALAERGEGGTVEGGGTPFEELSKTAADQVRALQRGSFCFVLRSGEEPADANPDESTMAIVAWRANSSVSPTVNRKELQHLLTKMESMKRIL